MDSICAEPKDPKRSLDATPEEIREAAQRVPFERATLDQLRDALALARLKLRRERLPNLFRPLIAICAISTAACATSTERLGLPPLRPAERVELPPYLGTWHEIASFSQSFQKGCTAATATYTARPDGERG